MTPRGMSGTDVSKGVWAKILKPLKIVFWVIVGLLVIGAAIAIYIEVKS